MQRSKAIGFVTFCLLSGSAWFLDNVFPSELPSLERQSLHYAVVTLIVGTLASFRSRGKGFPRLPFLPLVICSLLLLGLPILLDNLAYTQFSKNGVELFALTPLFIVIGATAFPGATSSPSRSLMMPALIGFAGALFLLPFELPSTAHSGFLFAIVIVAALSTAAGSLWIYNLLGEVPILPALIVLGGANALFLAATAIFCHSTLPGMDILRWEVFRAAIFDLPELLLFVWLLRELTPTRLASRFLLVPLLSTLEGIKMLHLPINLRMGIAAVLVAGSGVILLLNNVSVDSEIPPSLGLR